MRPTRRLVFSLLASATLGGSQSAPAARARRPLSGAKTSRTKGAIPAGSNQLTVASTAGFAVGDHIIVELGGEASGGRPGSPGVGGVWPILNYPDETAMQADRSQPANTFCYCVGSGLVYRWSGPGRPSVWFNEISEYYWRYAVALALTARVTAVSGNTLTLSKAAAAASTNANVYFDNTPVFNAASAVAGPNTALIWPAGSFACGSVMTLRGQAGMAVTGQGQSRTKLFSPRGVVTVGLEINACPHCEVSGLTLAGNAYLTHGWGLDFRYTTQTSTPQWNYALMFTSSDHANAHDLTFTYPWYAASTHYCAYATFSRLTVRTDGMQRYVSWMINFVNSNNCNSYDCALTSTYLTPAFEIFASNDCGHIRPIMVNGLIALNSTGGCVIDSPRITITPMSALSHLSVPEPGTPIINVNTNIPQNPGQAGNRILNMDIVVQGFINAANDVPEGVNVNGKTRDTLISGGTYRAPGYLMPTTQYGAQAVNSDANAINTMVRNLTVLGLARDGGTPGHPGYSNIYVANGSVIGCKAATIGCAGPHCRVS